MKSYVNREQTYIPSYNLETAASSFQTLEQGHLNAIQTTSELKNAIGQLDLNETEEDFRQTLYNEIESTVENNTMYGNAYFALDDIIKKSGDITSNPELIGRLNAQKAYKDNIAAIDARTDITDDVKAMSKAISPYYYRDKQTGELINNGVWKPGYNPVRSYDINETLQLVSKYVSPDSGQNTVTTFLDVNGNPTTQWVPGQSIGVLNTTTGAWERVSEDKLRAAWDAAIAANPGIMASLRQDYEVGQWKYNQTGEDTYSVIGQDGSRITFDEYVNRIIDPYVKAKSYYNTKSTVNWNDATIKAYNAQLAATAAAQTENQIPSFDGIKGTAYNAELKNDTITRDVTTINQGTSQIRSYIANLPGINQYAIDLNKINLNKPEQTRTALVNAGLPVEQVNTIMDEYNRISNFTHGERTNYNELNDNYSQRGIAARKLIDAMNTGIEYDLSDLPDNNAYQRWGKRYAEMKDKIFSNGNLYAKLDKKTFDNFIASLGGLDNARSLGYNIQMEDNKYLIGLDEKNSSQLFNFIKGLNTAYKDNSLWRKVKNVVTFGSIAKIGYIDETGDFKTFSNGENRSKLGEDIFDVLLGFENKLQNIATRQNISNEALTYIESGTNYPGAVPEAVMANNRALTTTDSKEFNFQKNVSELWNDNYKQMLPNEGIINSNCMVLNTEDKKSGYQTYRQINDKEVLVITQYLQNGGWEKCTPTFNLSKTGTPTVLISIPVKDKKPYYIRLDSVGSPQMRALANDPTLMAGSQLIKSAAINKKEDILFYRNNVGETSYISLKPVDMQGNQYRIVYGDGSESDNIIDYKTATQLKKNYLDLKELYQNKYSLSPEQLVQMKQALIQDLQGYTYEQNDKQIRVPGIAEIIGGIPGFNGDYSALVDYIIGY